MSQSAGSVHPGVLDTESQRAVEVVQRAADDIIRQKDQIIDW